ncbi:hypothetical protein TWF970_005759 [Orbilia oligospora]|uniref:Clr5 domain-containing protein n=1 Tax=Orbilia oligospora TaxID=2813651 RepID=A0A7C8VNY4_ORBOL|nr:hypothetical protein TWF970_005759 [Orbilia oligospora]
MELQWKPPVSTVTRPKRRAAANIYETDIEKHKEIILDLASQGTYQSTIETLRNDHSFEISIDQLKKFLKLWGFQKKPRRNPPTPTGYPTDLIATPTPNINRQTSKILEPGNPFPMVSSTKSGVSGLFSLFAVASLPNIMTYSAHERQSTESWVVQYQPGAPPQSNAKEFTNEPPKLLDDDIDALISNIERLELNNLEVFAERNIREILPRLAQSIEVEPELETYEGASEDFRKLLKCLRGISTTGVDTGGLSLIKSSSTRDLEQGITSITWTNKLTKLLLHSQTKKIKGHTAMVNIKKMQFRSPGDETFEMTDTNIILRPKRDQSHSRLGDSRVLNILCRSREQYTPGLLVSLRSYQAIEHLDGIDNILKAALRGDLEEIQQRCSKGEWSLRSCDQQYAISGAFVSQAPVQRREGCMGIVKLIAAEAPDMFLENEKVISWLCTAAFNSLDQNRGINDTLLDKILRYALLAGFEFGLSPSGVLLKCILLGSINHVNLVFYNDMDYIAIDDQFVKNFIMFDIGPDQYFRAFSSEPSLMAEEFSGKLGILLERLGVEKDLVSILRYLFHYADVPFETMVKSLKVTIDAIGDIYNRPITSNGTDPSLDKHYSPDYGVLFCAIAHFYKRHEQWYAALAECRYKYTRLQAHQWEARYLNLSWDKYNCFLKNLEKQEGGRFPIWDHSIFEALAEVLDRQVGGWLPHPRMIMVSHINFSPYIKTLELKNE